MATESIPTPQRQSEAARLPGVLWDPKATFHDVATRPRPWAPLVLLALVSLVFSYAFTQRVGWDRFMRQQMESNPRAAERMQNVPAEQRDRVIEVQARVASIMGYAGSVLAMPLFAAIAAGIFLFIFKTFLSAQLTFRQVFGIVSYALLPFVISSLMALAVVLVKDPNEFDLQRPTMTNVAAFMDPLTTPKWLLSLGGSLDAFSFWVVTLMATGLSVAAREVSWGTSLASVAGVWAVLVLLKIGWAAMFG